MVDGSVMRGNFETPPSSAFSVESGRELVGGDAALYSSMSTELESSCTSVPARLVTKLHQRESNHCSDAMNFAVLSLDG